MGSSGLFVIMENNHNIPPKLTVTETIQGLKSWFSYLTSKWLLGLVICILAGLCGVLYAYLKKPKYESVLTFALEDNQAGFGGALSLAAEFGLSLGQSNGTFNSDNILGIITSRRIIESVLLSEDSFNNRKVTMIDYYLDIHEMKKSFEKENGLKPLSYPVGQARKQFSPIQDSVLYVVYKTIIEDQLTAEKQDKKSAIYQIKYVDSDERFAKVMTDKVIAKTIDFYTELRSKKSRETLEILEKRTAELRGSVNSAISSRASVQDANINPTFSAAQTPLQKKQIDISVYGTAYEELYKNLELARYQYLKDIPLLQIIDAPAFPLKKDKPGRLFTGIKFALIAGFLLLMILTAIFMLKNALKKEQIEISA